LNDYFLHLQYLNNSFGWAIHENKYTELKRQHDKMYASLKFTSEIVGRKTSLPHYLRGAIFLVQLFVLMKV